MLDFDPALLVEDAGYLVDLGRGIWLMDDHRWALKVWETQRTGNRYVLIHADYHWDCCYDFHNLPNEEARLLAASSEQVSKLVAEGELIQYDSFIVPAIKRGLVHTVHFYCLQKSVGDDALDEDFLRACGAYQVIHTDANSLAVAQISGPYIFDICLDLFNRSKVSAEGDLWSDAEVLDFLVTMKSLVRHAELVTVSMSFNYSGTASDTRHLVQLVIPELLAFRQ